MFKRSVFLWVLFTCLVMGSAHGADIPGMQKPVVFAIAAVGQESSAQISQRAGRAPYFHLYDESGGPLEVVENPYLDLMFGTGPAAAGMLADKGATVLVGQLVPGPKMLDALKYRQLQFEQHSGTVEEMVDILKK